jgi:hypothetical protein
MDTLREPIAFIFSVADTWVPICQTSRRYIPADSDLHSRGRGNLKSHLVQQLLFKIHAVAQLVEALRYKPEGREFDFRWCHSNFSLTQSFRPH